MFVDWMIFPELTLMLAGSARVSEQQVFRKSDVENKHTLQFNSHRLSWLDSEIVSHIYNI